MVPKPQRTAFLVCYTAVYYPRAGGGSLRQASTPYSPTRHSISGLNRRWTVSWTDVPKQETVPRQQSTARPDETHLCRALFVLVPGGEQGTRCLLVQPSAQLVVIPTLARKLPGGRVLIAQISLGGRLEVSAHGAIMRVFRFLVIC
jgi:hypothetical protein